MLRLMVSVFGMVAWIAGPKFSHADWMIALAGASDSSAPRLMANGSLAFSN